ncbi:phosphoribosylaminoimidazolesuccinocarboxamide synthase [Saccharothrix violaceirubra]|uniref:Phosphoribosylaminoimidazole-succinocarboxamide synthase n=1 Tax=Saccharothrix violaceirubra TaxID=413306 RepID=A0A7W7TAG3_9PSEU|nr:phosphoribosylaminoimidazolesuccinocarboxamide synthase [Saccharothrix violaceirubra]MBB4969524.1 phosphoribosylaminoimidazole-succinocarboxamide synthase [Saccharothrix violaceirubra]
MPTLADYPVVATGKVRSIHEVDDDLLLFVASDRISAFDHVLSTPIPDKGRVLTAMSVFWFTQLADVVPNHLVAWDDARIPEEVRGRALLVRKLRMLPVEAVARGYLTGSGLAEYRVSGSVCGVSLPAGLSEASELPSPIFTPATKAAVGEHDENVDFAHVESLLGADLAARVRDMTLAVYEAGRELARSRGVILADTKFEFGLAPDGTLVLADEVLTPDSSRYWPAEGYSAGVVQPSFDKQYVRDWLTSPASGWDRASDTPPPALPSDVVSATRSRYIEAHDLITGSPFTSWP